MGHFLNLKIIYRALRVTQTEFQIARNISDFSLPKGSVTQNAFPFRIFAITYPFFGIFPFTTRSAAAWNVSPFSPVLFGFVIKKENNIFLLIISKSLLKVVTLTNTQLQWLFIGPEQVTSHSQFTRDLWYISRIPAFYHIFDGAFRWHCYTI